LIVEGVRDEGSRAGQQGALCGPSVFSQAQRDDGSRGSFHGQAAQLLFLTIQGISHEHNVGRRLLSLADRIFQAADQANDSKIALEHKDAQNALREL
jgi:hypothetical protein